MKKAAAITKVNTRNWKRDMLASPVGSLTSRLRSILPLRIISRMAMPSPAKNPSATKAVAWTELKAMGSPFTYVLLGAFLKQKRISFARQVDGMAAGDDGQSAGRDFWQLALRPRGCGVRKVRRCGP